MGLDLFARLHPVLVHFPIALLATAWLYEFARKKAAGEPRPAVSRACLTLGTLGAVLAALSGWTAADGSSLARSMPGTLGWHRWSGVALATAALASTVLGLAADRGKRVPYRWLLSLVLVLVVVSGHLGGTLVHGSDFLLGAFERDEPEPEPSPRPAPQPVDPGGLALPAASGASDAPSYARDVAPLLAARCVDCHGPKKRKGGLRLDRIGELLAAPGDPPAIVPGDADASAIVQRVELPADDADRMPADGPPLSAEERALLRRWIALGAPLDGAR